MRVKAIGLSYQLIVMDVFLAMNVVDRILELCEPIYTNHDNTWVSDPYNLTYEKHIDLSFET